LEQAALLEVLRIIREEEPPRPSTRLSTIAELPSIAARRGMEPKKLSGLVRGELDWIVMKCLEKDRNRRYETANSLALDLQRYLADEPVQAGPPSAGYRFRKFARRNRRALAALALLGVVLSVAAIVLIVSNVRINRALTERNKAYDVLDTAKQNAERAYQTAAEALTGERHALAIYGVSLADREWLAGHSDKAERALDDCPPGNRHWEWHYLKRLCNQDLHRVQFPVADSWTGSPGAFSPDGKLFVSNPDPGQTLAVVDVETGRKERTLITNGLVLSPDWQRTLATKGGARDATTGETTADFEIRDTGSGRPLTALGRYDARARVAIHPDGRRMIVFSPRQAPRILDHEGHQLGILNCPAGVTGVAAYSPDGNYLAVASGLSNQPGELRQWDLRTGKEAGSFDGHPAGVASLCFSPDGRLLVSGGHDKTVKVWDTRTGREFLTLRGHTASVRHVTFSPDGRLLVSVGQDGTALIWEGRPWEETPGRVIDLSQGFRGPRRPASEGSAPERRSP
jgi:hypothetical protein